MEHSGGCSSRTNEIASNGMQSDDEVVKQMRQPKRTTRRKDASPDRTREFQGLKTAVHGSSGISLNDSDTSVELESDADLSSDVRREEDDVVSSSPSIELGRAHRRELESDEGYDQTDLFPMQTEKDEPFTLGPKVAMSSNSSTPAPPTLRLSGARWLPSFVEFNEQTEIGPSSTGRCSRNSHIVLEKTDIVPTIPYVLNVIKDHFLDQQRILRENIESWERIQIESDKHTVVAERYERMLKESTEGLLQAEENERSVLEVERVANFHSASRMQDRWRRGLEQYRIYAREKRNAAAQQHATNEERMKQLREEGESIKDQLQRHSHRVEKVMSAFKEHDMGELIQELAIAAGRLADDVWLLGRLENVQHIQQH